jgi:hypothetical protein
MTATKVGDAIYIDGLGNTFATITADIADITWIEDKGGGIYELKGTHDFDLRPGAELIVGNSGDYSFAEELQCKGSATNSILALFRSTSVIKMYGQSGFDLQAGTYRADLNLISGQLFTRGSATYRPYFKNLYQGNFRTDYLSDESAFDNDIRDCEYLSMSLKAGSGTAPCLYDLRGVPKGDRFYRCIFDGYPGGASRRGTPPNATTATRVDQLYKVLFEECTFKNFAPTAFRRYFRMKNCTWENCSQAIYQPQNPISFPDPYRNFMQDVPGGIYDWLDGVEHASGRWAQNFLFVEGGIFEASNVTHHIYNQLSSLLLLKNCNLKAGPSIGIYAGDSQGMVVLWGTTNTLSASLVSANQTRGRIVRGYPLDITVRDENSAPLEGASIYVQQSEDKEEWRIVTGSDGKPVTYPPLAGVLVLIHEHYEGGTPSWVKWSDSVVGGRYHNVVVSAPGYATQAFQLEMDQDRTLGVDMVPASLQDTADAILARVRRLQDR